MATNNNRRLNLDKTVCCFFVLFLSVYFLESIGGFFMTSAIVSIEKQFQIPSKISGMMVSAGDFGYIPSVVFVAYLGSKGNRARWIGGGCILIAIANLLISSSHFIFPVEEIKLNSSTLKWHIESDLNRLPIDTGFDQFLSELPEEQWSQPIRNKLNNNYLQETSNSWLSEFDQCIQQDLNLINKENVTCLAFYKFLQKYNAANKTDVDNLRQLSTTSYAFCDKTLNVLRSMIEEIRCNNDVSNIGPTATIFFGLLILGIGRTMPFSLGLPLIDDNVRKSNLPLYFAGMFCIRIMGPLVGFWMGSYFNKLYYKGEAPHGITPKDPMWIGRWWQGFMSIGGVLFFPALLLFCFRNPKPSEEKLVDGEEKNSRGLALVDRHLVKSKNGKIPKNLNAMSLDFKQNISTVFKRPIYRWAMIGRIIDVLAFKGFHIFLPKYLELQFGIPQYLVNRLMGVVGIISFAVGVLFGSLLMRKLHLQGRKAALLVAITGVLSACFSLLNSNVGCKSTMTALGESILLNKNQKLINSTKNYCLNGCNCENSPLYPVCDISGSKVFFSPCHAGCQLTNITSILNTQKTPIFDNCTCTVNNGKVSRDFCDEKDCWNKLYWYFANMAMGGIVGGMGVVPGVLIMLRSVPPKHRSISLGFNGFLVSLLATLPSPIIWGAIIDNFCLFWTQKCDNKGACALYATDKLRVWLHLLYGALRLCSFIADLFVIYHSKGLKLIDPDEEKLEEENKNEENDFEEKIEEDTKEMKFTHIHDICCAPPDYENEGEKKIFKKDEEIKLERRLSLPPFSPQKSFSLPQELKPKGIHRRTASKDDKYLNEEKEFLFISPSEFEAIRRSTSQLPFVE